ncbi:hypothetical protein ABXN37_20030 [Piscinibacter sakaiensis]|uniref:hypothetical protein n=1 Tax=Piscinibacter sakaiensis TaxID=1547922 RepID=UPI00372CE59E
MKALRRLFAGAVAARPVVKVGTAPSGLAIASSRKARRASLRTSGLLPKPSANSGASAAGVVGVVGGVTAFSVACRLGGEPAGAVGGVVLNSVVARRPCAIRLLVVSFDGSAVSTLLAKGAL